MPDSIVVLKISTDLINYCLLVPFKILLHIEAFLPSIMTFNFPIALPTCVVPKIPTNVVILYIILNSRLIIPTLFFQWKNKNKHKNIH